MTMKKIIGCIRKADKDYNMIQENDRIAVGISGGKDSMLLLLALHYYQQSCRFNKIKNFEVVGIHVEMGFPDMSFEEVDRFCLDKGIEFHHYPSSIYDILKLQANEDGTLKCSLCSKFKKATVISAAKEYHCNRVAFAHHADDAIETLLMNAIYGGRLATFKPHMFLTNTEMDFIRPFVYAFESDIRSAVEATKIPVVKSTCPMDGYTKRQDAKDMLNNLYKNYPMAKENFLLMLHNEDKTDLWMKQKKD